jgi:ribosome-binding protein aMBF1 (putative translation factor)
MSASEPDPVVSAQRAATTDDSTTEREELLEQIETTREELGATVEALAHKVDVKAQVHEKVEERKQHLHQVQAEATGKLRQTLDGPAVPAAIAAVGVLLLWIGRRRRMRAGL